MYRSTKGASKARRDQINAEIRNLKDLLPISDADKSRLSYLHIMSLACMYTRKSVFFSQDFSVSDTFLSLPELSELVHTLPGFLLLLTSEGKLLYLSDNVSEHLGHSMVDLVAQSDSIYDIIDPSDHFIMRSNLVPVTTPDTERLFRCRFNTSKFVRRQGSGNKVVLVRARSLPSPYHSASYWTSNPAWVCFCSPLDQQIPQHTTTANPLPTPPAEQAFLLACFQSQHSRDMRLQTAQDCISVYLGYNVETLQSRSWYSLLHPRDLAHASAQHCNLLREGGQKQVEMVVQVEAADHSWVWLYMVLQLQNGEYPISCQNYVISESEAWSVRQQLCSEQDQYALLYQEGLPQQCSEPLATPEQVFTPSSSGLSAQSFDFNFTTSGRSSSEEMSGRTTQSSLGLGSDPCPSFFVNEDTFSQQHGNHQMWLPAVRKLSTQSAPIAVPSQLSDMTSMTGACMAGPTSVTPTPLCSISMPKSQIVGELLATPPYTPHFGTGRFMFGDELFKPESINAPSPFTPVMPSSDQPMSLSTGVGLRVSVQHCSRSLYEKLPPTPDSPGNEECLLSALPEIRGPLYVDVPHSVHPRPPEGLLTPEVSPTEQPRTGFFPKEADDDRDRLEISLLAQYLSSVVEGFCHDRSLATHPHLPDLLQQPAPTQSPAPPSCQFPSTTCWRDINLSLVEDELSLFQERLQQAATPSSSTTSSFSPTSPHSYNLPPALLSKQEGTLVGGHHLCSAHTTCCNSIAGGRLEESRAPIEGEVLTESVMDVEMLPPELPSTVPASPESTLAPAPPIGIPGVPCAQSLLEELVTLEPVFEATASISPALRQQPELYQLPIFQESPQHFYQDGTGDHMF